MKGKHYYQDRYVTLYCGDARELLPHVGEFQSVITDPVWPNCPEGLLQGWENPQQLFREVCDLLPLDLRQLVVILRNDSDPRFLQAVPDRFPFQQVAWLQYVMPGYLGRVLGGNECGYVFGEPIAVAEGRRVIPSVSPKAQPKDRPANGHPCSRALVHMKFLVKWFSDDHETICDPFCGSGTTLEAAKLLGRKAIGIEIEEKHAERTANRLRQGVFEFPECK